MSSAVKDAAVLGALGAVVVTITVLGVQAIAIAVALSAFEVQIGFTQAVSISFLFSLLISRDDIGQKAGE